MPKISVIATAHNYGRYLPQAVESVLAQTCDDWELIVVNDGSTDNTAEILERYAAQPRIRVLTLEGVGLARAANAGIRASTGDYVIRLDADDYFDENILLVLANVLDRHPELGMVFPDYYQVSRHGEVIDLVRQPKINDEVTLLDRSALAAGALYRRSCFDAIGGYSEHLTRQEDYDFWIRFIDKFHVYNVQLPLMYYRQHNNSMSRNAEQRMQARRAVKREFAESARQLDDRKTLYVLPVVADNRFRQGLPLVEMHGRPLFTYLLEKVLSVDLFDRVIVDTEDEEVAAIAREWGADAPFIRPRSLAKLTTSTDDVLRHMIKVLDEDEGYRPDVILMAYYNFPFVTAAHLEEALHTLAIHHCDSVISVGPNMRFHWQPGPHGLAPVLYPRVMLTEQKWITYEERGGIFALDVNNLQGDRFLGNSVRFIEVSESEGLRIDSDFNFWIAEQMIKNGYKPSAGGVKAGERLPRMATNT